MLLDSWNDSGKPPSSSSWTDTNNYEKILIIIINLTEYLESHTYKEMTMS